MENSTDPEYLKKKFEESQNRLRITGAGGITISSGAQSNLDSPIEQAKSFADRKNLMTYKNGVASFGVKRSNLPNARPRNSNLPPSDIRIFALGENKPKESKEKNNERK